MRISTLKKQLNILKTYLWEFCEVNGIREQELKNYLIIVGDKLDRSIMVVNVDDQRDIKLGIKLDEVEKYEVFGEITLLGDKFPNTLKMISNTN